MNMNRMIFRSAQLRVTALGFSMIEVLMALLVITFGLLGVAGMQALSVGNTSTAGFRSIAALEAQSIASAMSANPTYWQTQTVPKTTSVSVSGTTITITSSDTGLAGTGTLNNTPNASNPPQPLATTACTTTACAGPTYMAQADVLNWGNALFVTLPGGAGQINCTQASSTTTTSASGAITIQKIPASCQIVITWSEKALSQNQTVATTATAASYDFEMAVIP